MLSGLICADCVATTTTCCGPLAETACICSPTTMPHCVTGAHWGGSAAGCPPTRPCMASTICGVRTSLGMIGATVNPGGKSLASAVVREMSYPPGGSEGTDPARPDADVAPDSGRPV